MKINPSGFPNSGIRAAVAALSLSAAGLVGLVSHEGYTDQAVQPLPGDKWTYGFGSTTREDGTAVLPGDKITPVRALIKAQQDVSGKEAEIKRCLGPDAAMHQHEWDFVVSMAYNIGTARWCGSTMAQLFRANQHEAACKQVMRWTFYQGKDCLDRSNKCYGLVERRQKEYLQCMGQS